MRFHSQNLNEKQPRSERYGWMLRHGRCWLQMLKWEWHCEWAICHGRRSWGLTLDLVDGHQDETIGGHLSLGWLFAFYWGLNTGFKSWPKRFLERITSREKQMRIGPCIHCKQPYETHWFGAWLERKSFRRGCQTGGTSFQPEYAYWPTDGRTIGVRFFDGTVWIDLWHDPMEWHRSDPWWWEIKIHVRDLLLGKPKYSSNALETREVVIPMPEGGYFGRATLSEDSWKRRWTTKRVLRVEIQMNEGQQIPVPGKGENSYDCTEDATYSLCTPAKSIFDGVIQMTENVMKTRISRGGWYWKPSRLKTA